MRGKTPSNGSEQPRALIAATRHFEDDRVALPAAGADRGQADTAAAPAQFVRSGVRTIRAPLAPIGWPSAIAPPLTLTLVRVDAEAPARR